MKFVQDYIHSTMFGGRCRIRLYLPEEPDDSPVVICTELADNPGMSITQCAHVLAPEIVSSHELDRPVIWIEHHEEGSQGEEEDPQTFNIVNFGPYRFKGHYWGQPQLAAVSTPTRESVDRQTVEALIGERVGA